MKEFYESPLSSRYASNEIKCLFSQLYRARIFRRLWVALANAEMELGLPINKSQVDELIKYQDDVDFEAIAQKELETRHDVMAHIHVYGDQCPHAKPIIHLGATSCYVTDNADIIIMREGLQILLGKLICVIRELALFADKYKNLPCLGFTHFQPAQPTTVGKRAALWIQDLIMDVNDLEALINSMMLLGSKGTTGTQASFLELFDGDHLKVNQLDHKIAQRFGFTASFAVSGQTYTRKLDSKVLNVLSGIAQSAAKFSNDIRLLQHLKEVEEPFEPGQVGSSAMAYKRNPMRTERMASLCRYVIVDALNPHITAATQWFERTLDDSANKRISIPEAFLAVDAILALYLNVSKGLVVYRNMIAKNLRRELPFIATENILMAAVKRGGDRQELHERLRMHSMAAGYQIKELGLENDLLERVAADPVFCIDIDTLESLMNPMLYIGCAKQQTEEFLENQALPFIQRLPCNFCVKDEVTV